jgi:adenylate kinase family enzyme
MSSLKVHIVGASGSGTTTLARALAPALGATALDSDDYFWWPTDPPFRDRRDRAVRHRLVMADLVQHPRAILSGAIIGWGDDVEHAFDLVVFLSLPHDLRVSRLRARELARYGRINEPFIAWAAGYDDDPPTSPTRNRRRQLEWLTARRCPVLRLEGDLTVAERVARVLEQLAPLAPSAP